MRPLVFVLCFTVCSISCAMAPEPPDWSAFLSPEEAAQGFYPLFNGQDFDGWWMRGANKEAFAAQDGVLFVKGAKGGDWLFTVREYENFVLRYEYRCAGGHGNSGVAIRATREGNPAFTGMEIQVLQPGWKVPWQRSGALYATVPPKVEADKPAGEWNSVEILCDGPRIRTIMNGAELYDIKTTDFTEEKDWQKPLANRAKSGFIALQNHSDPVEFRKIRIKPLPGGEGWRPLFNGKDLEGWRVVGDAKFEVLEGGVLQVNGAGMTRRSELRTLEEFDDFELQLSFRPHKGANSGVFLRGKGDDPWPNSCEVQIDTDDPKQFTGAVWNQAPARELRADDGRWNHMHMVANGPNIQVAINGKTVVDFISARYDRYPKGWLSLQGHDPNSIVDFKDIEIKPIKQ